MGTELMWGRNAIRPYVERPAIPWRMKVSGALERAQAQRTVERLPILHDPTISEAVTSLDATDE